MVLLDQQNLWHGGDSLREINFNWTIGFSLQMVSSQQIFAAFFVRRKRYSVSDRNRWITGARELRTTLQLYLDFSKSQGCDKIVREVEDSENRGKFMRASYPRDQGNSLKSRGIRKIEVQL